MSTRTNTIHRRLAISVALAAAGLAALPAAGSAAETFGSRLINAPNTGACNGVTPPCTYVSYIHPSDPNGDPYAGGAPSDGVITKFRIRAYGSGGPGTPATVTFRVADISRDNPDSAVAAAVGTGPTVTIAGSGEVEEFPGRLPVRKGNHLAIDTSDANAVYASSGDKFTYVYSPPLADGAGPRGSDMVTEELLVAAVVEPDADGDGFGDETQDQCLGNGSDAQAPCTVPAGDDKVRPRVTAMAVTVAARGARRLSYRLSELANVTAVLQRAAKGRRARGKCRKPNARNRARKRCTRWVTVKTIAHDGVAGRNRLTLAPRKPRPGRYRVLVTAEDQAGNVSATKRIGFRVRR